MLDTEAAGKAGKIDAGSVNTQDAIGTVGKRHPVVQNDADDFAETQGDDGQVIPAHAQGRIADDAPGDASRKGRHRQAEPERDMKVDAQ